MNNIYFEEIFEYPITEFISHLDNDLNERIFFSGKYGIGKTKFLQRFFDDKNQTTAFGTVKYDVYSLFPVNYSISSNEDIIKYIKYDIIIELLKKKVSVNEIDLKFIDTLPLFVKNNLDKVAATIAYMVPKVGKELIDIFDKIQELHKEFTKFHKTIVHSEGDKLIEYLEQLEEKGGGLYENDVISKIITKTIGQTEERQPVLIVDDIDRIDPEHVFRILNIFAANFDQRSGSKKNKFSFAKIIIVCDFHNIQNIFHHKYGTEVDFIGYIDKFYSSDIYWFDNISAIKGIVNKIIKTISFNPNDPNEDSIFWRSSFNNQFVSKSIQSFLAGSYINLRSLIKMHNRRIKYQVELVPLLKDMEIPAWKIPFLIQLKILRDFLGSTKNMISVFKKCLERNTILEHYDRYIGDLMYIQSCVDKEYLPMKNFEFPYIDKSFVLEPQRGENNQIIDVIYGSDGGKLPNGEIQRGVPPILTNKFFWQLLIDVCDNLNRIGYLE